MAERRMFSRSIVESARFLKMPVLAQNLYFHLVMYADDDGVVEAYSVINLVRANEENLRILENRGFIKILNEDLVTYIVDWREQNKIRPDRKKDSIYKNILLQHEPGVDLLKRKKRSDIVKKNGPSMDREMSAQDSVDQDSVDQGSIEERSAETTHIKNIKYQLDHEYLTREEYQELTRKYSSDVVDSVINRILSKPYHGCLNTWTISLWCAEQDEAGHAPIATYKESERSKLLNRLAAERLEYGK